MFYAGRFYAFPLGTHTEECIILERQTPIQIDSDIGRRAYNWLRIVVIYDDRCLHLAKDYIASGSRLIISLDNRHGPLREIKCG